MKGRQLRLTAAVLLLQPLSILCRNFQDIDLYTMGFPRGDSRGQTNVFRQARQCLPGPVSLAELNKAGLYLALKQRLLCCTMFTNHFCRGALSAG